MLNILLILIVAVPNLSKASPIETGILPAETKLSMYDEALKKCPAINKTSIRNHTEFSMCTDWAKINSTTKFSTKNMADIRCLLYYDTLVSFCVNAGELLSIHPNIVDNIKLDKSVDVIKICDRESSLFHGKNREHNLSAIVIQNSTDNDCLGLCLDTTTLKANSFCYKAYYFATFKVEELKSAIMDAVNSQPKSEESGNVEPQPPPNKSDKVVEAQKNQDHIISSNKSVETKLGQDPVKEGNKPLPVNPKDQNLEEKPGNKDKAAQNLNTNVGVNENAVEPNNQMLPAEEVIPDAKPPSSPAQHSVTEAPKIKPAPQNEQPANNIQQIESNPVKDEEKIDKIEQTIIKNDNIDDSDDEDNSNRDDFNYDDVPKEGLKNTLDKVEEVKQSKPEALEDDSLGTTQEEITDGESYFFSYFMAMMCFCVFGYVGYHNRQKIFALVLEGKRGRRPQRGGRRPNSANYHKLDSNLEEALSSSVKKSASNVIY